MPSLSTYCSKVPSKVPSKASNVPSLERGAGVETSYGSKTITVILLGVLDSRPPRETPPVPFAFFAPITSPILALPHFSASHHPLGQTRLLSRTISRGNRRGRHQSCSLGRATEQKMMQMDASMAD
ncbi:hypothetical protein G6O67_002305 [Ophiocordyceps sinensis]|uniref:Uncharacterized protein n=2 Tax=Ophiocordyceps sinensis TaxID=72228 RepID=A0A8H4PU25_9HYPO|nr:hypothetical protein OCS_04720 [Ophiocordyceps sinensis CO18]KAF4510417.1 hypothetical protein G6O67_002305 [Ophiocordyceps sinensis]